jgi:ATP-dependent DNA ligase
VPGRRAAVATLPARSCLIDGEAIVTGLQCSTSSAGTGPARPRVFCAFDLLELDGEDLRREPIETRKYVGADFNGAIL